MRCRTRGAYWELVGSDVVEHVEQRMHAMENCIAELDGKLGAALNTRLLDVLKAAIVPLAEHVTERLADVENQMLANHNKGEVETASFLRLFTFIGLLVSFVIFSVCRFSFASCACACLALCCTCYQLRIIKFWSHDWRDRRTVILRLLGRSLS